MPLPSTLSAGWYELTVAPVSGTVLGELQAAVSLLTTTVHVYVASSYQGYVSDWSTCSASCGKGHQVSGHGVWMCIGCVVRGDGVFYVSPSSSFQTRVVNCTFVGTTPHTAAEHNSLCWPDGNVPLDTISCFAPDACPQPEWFASDWSECSAPCGWGNRTRSVSCLSGDGASTLVDAACEASPKPTSLVPCASFPCEG